MLDSQLLELLKRLDYFLSGSALLPERSLLPTFNNSDLLNMIRNHTELSGSIREVYEDKELRNKILGGEFDSLIANYNLETAWDAENSLGMLKDCLKTMHNNELILSPSLDLPQIQNEDQIKTLVSEYGRILNNAAEKSTLSTDDLSTLNRSAASIVTEAKSEKITLNFLKNAYENAILREKILKGDFDYLMDEYLDEENFESRDNFELLKEALQIMKDCKEQEANRPDNSVVLQNSSQSPLSLNNTLNLIDKSI